MGVSNAETPQPKARPRHRREEIAKNAGELFSSRGFHSVRMDDIAEASDITARALYRHYNSKQALLAHVVLADQQRLMDTLSLLTSTPVGERDLDTMLAAITDAALDSRRLSLLWRREARHLGTEDYQRSRDQSRAMASQFRELLFGDRRPELDDAAVEIRTWVVVSIVYSPAHYEYTLTRSSLARELVAGSRRVLDQPAANAADGPDSEVAPRASSSRREQLLYAGAKLFRNKGFAGVSIDDIGAPIGLVGPALYRYFDTKADILAAAVVRLDEWLALEMTRALRTTNADAQIIAHLVEGYIRVALEATDLLAVSLTERHHLPDGVTERLDRIRTAYLAEWQRWLSVARPELPDALVAMMVMTAKTVIDDCVRIPHLRRYPTLGPELLQACLALIGL